MGVTYDAIDRAGKHVLDCDKIYELANDQLFEQAEGGIVSLDGVMELRGRLERAGQLTGRIDGLIHWMRNRCDGRDVMLVSEFTCDVGCPEVEWHNGEGRIADGWTWDDIYKMAKEADAFKREAVKV